MLLELPSNSYQILKYSGLTGSAGSENVNKEKVLPDTDALHAEKGLFRPKTLAFLAPILPKVLVPIVGIGIEIVKVVVKPACFFLLVNN